MMFYNRKKRKCNVWDLQANKLHKQNVANGIQKK